jgi:Tfp pilus assembly protein PilF
MAQLIAGFVLLATFAFSSSFYQQFYIPKLIVFYGMATTCLGFLVSRRQVFLPSKTCLIFIASFLIVAVTLGVRSPAPLTAFMLWAFYFGGCLLFVTLINLERSSLETLLKAVFCAALAQLVLVIAQSLSVQSVMPEALIGHNGRIFGTVGNQEFLATLLGVGFYFSLHFRGQTSNQKTRRFLMAGGMALLIGLALSQSKGSLLFIGLYFLWKRFPSYKLVLALCLVALVLAVFAFPASVKGRLLLWIVASTMFARHIVSGVGLLQFENHYLDVVHTLFSAYPRLSEIFGENTAMSMDAHNIFLQFGAELGIAGLVLSLVFMGYGLRLVNDNRNYLGAALLFLLFKCLYTVVLTSVTGMILLVLVLATLSQQRAFRFSGIARRAAIAGMPLATFFFIASIFLGASDYFYQQGARALFMGQNDKAVENLTRALDVNRENADAHLALAHASYLKGDYDSMSGHIINALPYRKNKDTLKIAAYMFYYAKRYDDAFPLFQFLHATFPQHLSSLTKLASIYMLRGDYNRAYVMAQAALRTVPRKQAESDARNLKIAKQIAADSYPFISHPKNSNLKGQP